MIFANSRVDEVIFFLLMLLHWILEIFMALLAFLVFLLVPIHIVKYINERKPATLRILIVLVLLKVVWIFCQLFTLDETSYDRGHTCTIWGKDRHVYGPSDAGM